MRCRQAQELLSLVLDEAAGEYDRNRLELHLDDCADCRAHRDVLVRGTEVLRSAPMVEPSENFEWKVQLGIQRALRDSSTLREPDARPRRLWWTAATSAAVAAAIILGLGIGLSDRGATGSAPVNRTATPHFADTQPFEFVDLARPTQGQIQPVSGVLPGANEQRTPALTPVPVDEWFAMRRENLLLRQRVAQQHEVILRLQGTAPDVHISGVSDSGAVRDPR